MPTHEEYSDEAKKAAQRYLDQVATAPVRRMPTHEEYSDEAKKAAQRYLDQVAHIETLSDELEGWRNRAMIAETQIQHCRVREAELLAELDSYKQTLAVISAQYTTASKILLDGMATIDRLEHVKAKISMPALQAAIEDSPDDPADPVTPAVQTPPSGD
jgi:chromosome segregation ATPase